MNLKEIAKNTLLMGALVLPGCGADKDKCLVVENEHDPVITYSVSETMDYCQANREKIFSCINQMQRYDDAHDALTIHCNDVSLGLHVGQAFQDSGTFCVEGGAHLVCDED